MITLGLFTLLSERESAPDDGTLPIWLLPAPVENMVNGMTVYGQGWHADTQWYLGQVADLVKPGMRVLDFGAGTGILAIAAARMGAEVTACEIEPNALKLCQENCALNEVRVDVVTKPEGKFDLIFANMGLPTDPADDSYEHAKIRKLLADVLKPGGRLVLMEAPAPVIEDHSGTVIDPFGNIL